MQNPDIARLFDEVADLLEIQDANPFRVRAYRNAARTIRDFPEPLTDLVRAGTKDLTEIPGIGDDLAEKITEIVTSGALPLQQQLARKHLRGRLDRRRPETIGDLDILVTSDDGARAMERFVGYGEVANVVSKGETRATVKLRGGLQVDLRAVEPAAYGAALQYFTGSKAHNVELRQLAQGKKLKLNEYGLFRGTRRIAGETEAEIYDALGLDWIPPELREARGEIALAREHRLPKLVELSDVRGDLQMHTKATDGRGTIAEMADAARALQYEYIAITDHSKRVTMALGLDAKRLREQWRTIDEWNAGARGLTLLKSVELDILETGKLDLPDDVLAEADYVVATIHYGTNQTERELTRRLVGAAEHRWVDAIGHPTGRRLGEREPYRLDLDALARAR